MLSENPKGCIDYNLKKSIILEKIIKIIKTEIELNGISSIKTSTINYLETLVGKYKKNDEILNEIFSFKNRGDKNLGLRYDLTTPLNKFIEENKKALKLPFMRYETGNIYRDGPIKKGRLREFIQFDCDVVGFKGQEYEYELLELVFRIYKKLNLKVIIELNNMKILNGILEEFKFMKKDFSKIILEFDKLKKIGIKKVLENLKKFDEKKIKKILKILSENNFDEMKKMKKNKFIKEGFIELENLKKMCDFFKIDYKINLILARGLDIYTGNIFEVYEKNLKIKSSLGSGGRYDNSNGFNSFGISFGIIPIMEIINFENKSHSEIEILISPLNENDLKKSYLVQKYYRDKEIKTKIIYSYKLKNSFNYCNKNKIKYLAIIGEKDDKNFFTLKDLEKNVEHKIKF